jgi:hypothetical protein
MTRVTPALAALAALATLTGLSSPAAAVSRPETHDGFILRLTLGLGYEGLNLSDGEGTEIDLSGFGLSSSLVLGGVVANNLAIHGDFFGLAAVSPNVAINGEEFGEASNSSISLSGLGVGLTHWIMPLNLYLSATLGLAKASIDVEGDEFEADWGLAIRAMVGKEWWVADEWGIGIMAELTWANVPTEVDEGSASFLGFNVGMSLTFN